MDINFQQYLKDPELTRLEGEATGAAQKATQYASASSTLPFKLREAVMGKLNYNRDLIEQQNKALAEYISAPSAAREKYQDVWNPFQREKLVTQERAQAYEPYANLTDILGQRMGTISDIVGAGTAGWQSQVQGAQGAAELASGLYSNKFSYMKALMDAAVKEEEARLARQQEGRLGSDGGEGTDLASLLKKALGLGDGESTVTPTEPMPEGTPTRPDVFWQSPGGQWAWDFETKQWVPVVFD